MHPLAFQKWPMRSPAGKNGYFTYSVAHSIYKVAKSDVFLGNTSAQASPCSPSIKQFCNTFC